MRSSVWFLPVCLGLIICAAGQQIPESSQRPLNLMPLPSKVDRGAGQLMVDQSFTVGLTGYKEERLENARRRFLHNLSRRTGMPLVAQAADPAKASLVIHTEHASKEVQEPGEDESYVLEVTASGAKLSAATPLGTMHGLQTFLQLVEASPNGFTMPVVTIHDTPRFPWRGLMIDVGRHFIPLEVIKRNLDGMEAVKLNVFHWHLSENQGFRVESKKFPKLHEMGSDGLLYTQDEVRDLIEYARERGIRVYPEFDMPGHSTAWFVGYPEVASAPGPYEIERKWGIFDPAMDPSNEHVYKFVDELIGEMAKLFPDPYFHIGGDEVNGKQWDANPKIQEFMKAHGIKDNAALQTYFTERVQKIVSKHHKIMVGWDEILSPDIPKDIVIQSWRGQESLATAAKQGYRGLLSNGYYIDLMWSAARHYAVDPTSGAAANLSPEEKQRILGGEAAMWSEYVSTENVDSRIWPRTAAIAERLWSPEETGDVTSMYERLDQLSWRLDFLGLTHNSSYVPMLQRIAGRQDIRPLRELADLVEPVKDYTREETAPTVPLSTTPLNRLVDAARPESETARVFNNRVDMFIAGKCNDAATTADLRGIMSDWRDNEANLQPLIESSFLLKEVAPISENLSGLGRAGLQALDYIDRSERPADTWKTEQLALIERARKQNGQLLLMIVPGMEKLIEASLSGGACQTAQ
jgi:hexosaminidase